MNETIAKKLTEVAERRNENWQGYLRGDGSISGEFILVARNAPNSLARKVAIIDYLEEN